MGKTIFCIFWTFGIIAAVIGVGNIATRDTVLAGNSIDFNTSRNLQIDAETVTFKAASSGFFILRKESGEVVYGIPKDPPLGWNSRQYFVTEPQVIKGGKWLFDLGSASIVITSSESVNVRLIEKTPAMAWILFTLIGIVVWGFVIAITAEFS